MLNEITLMKDERGNNIKTVFGSNAHKFFFKHGDLLESLYNNTGTNVAFVYEIDGTIRAAQSSIEGAKQYMNDNRILVIKELSK